MTLILFRHNIAGGVRCLQIRHCGN